MRSSPSPAIAKPAAHAPAVAIDQLIASLQRTVRAAFPAPIWIHARLMQIQEIEGSEHQLITLESIEPPKRRRPTHCEGRIWRSKAPRIFDLFFFSPAVRDQPIGWCAEWLVEPKITNAFGLQLVVTDCRNLRPHHDNAAHH